MLLKLSRVNNTVSANSNDIIATAVLIVLIIVLGGLITVWEEN